MVVLSEITLNHGLFIRCAFMLRAMDVLFTSAQVKEKVYR